jgi:hypothetical protein
MRTLANITLSIVLVATLLWGGCLSCSQYFMVPSSRAGCCNPAGHCGKIPQPQSKDCHIQPFAPTKNSPDVTAPLTLMPLALSTDPTTSDQLHLSSTRSPAFFVAESSPPDLCLLYSVFRI